MGNSSLTADVLRTVAKRSELLVRLEEAPADKRELTADVDCSRSTVDRAVRELERLAFVRRTSDRFRLTIAGRLALDQYRECTSTLASMVQMNDILGDLSADVPLDTAIIRGADVLETPCHAPSEPLEEISDLFEHADRVRGFGAADRLPQFRERLHDRTVGGDLDAEFLLTEDLAAFLITEYPRIISDVLSTKNFDLYTLDSVPYELSIVETPARSVVFVMLIDDDLSLRGIIRNDSRAALEWADQLYRRYRATATLLSDIPLGDD